MKPSLDNSEQYPQKKPAKIYINKKKTEAKGEDLTENKLWIEYLVSKNEHICMVETDSDGTEEILNRFLGWLMIKSWNYCDFLYSLNPACVICLYQPKDDGWRWWIIFDGCGETLLLEGATWDVNVTHSNLISPPNLLHLGAHLQSALISDNERSLEGDATAEITDPL